MTNSLSATILSPLAARVVATWKQDCSGWAIKCHPPQTDPVNASTYMDSLPTRSASTMLSSFLGHPSPMAVFELDCDGQRKAVGLKLMPLHSNPVMVRQVLTAQTESSELDKVHPLLKRLNGMITYHWGSPSFLDLCAELGFDPATVRPRFRAPFKDPAEDLLRWSCTVKPVSDAWDTPRGRTRRAVFMVLEMMRADVYPGSKELDKLRDCWMGIDRGFLRHVEELDGLINSDQLLDMTGLDAGVIPPPEVPTFRLMFLPSRYGCGYNLTITGYPGPHEPDGWTLEGCDGLRGVAIEPDRDALWQHAWLRTATRRLREQGVLFLPLIEARAYLATKESAYWTWRAGGIPFSRFERRPALWKRLLWRIWPPTLLRDRELMARQLGTL